MPEAPGEVGHLVLLAHDQFPQPVVLQIVVMFGVLLSKHLTTDGLSHYFFAGLPATGHTS